jgi:alkaline phosphatase D
VNNRVRLAAFALHPLIALHAERGDQLQHAPPDAWLPGEHLPYYGSENPWDRRFFNQTPPRIGQPQMLELLEGRVQQAVDMSTARLAADKADVESHLVLALAHGVAGQMDLANASLETAITLGLPPSRLLADRGKLMERLHTTATWKQVEGLSTGLVHGPLLGHVTTGSVRFWVRTLSESVIEVLVSERGDFERPDGRGESRTSAARDFTGVVEVAGLRPDTRYRHQLRIDGRPVPRTQEWEFSTFPEPEAKRTLRIAFGGCAQHFPAHERMWDTIRLRRPDAFLTLGDNVDIDLPESVGPLHNYTYYQRQSRPEFSRLTASVPTYAIWDDHDAGIDDVFLGPYPDKPRWKVEHLELFERNWNNPPTGAPPEWPGVWHHFRAGPVEIFMLDGRYYRENFLKDSPSMLGPVQKAWLLGALRASTAPFKLLVSPVAWADDAKMEKTPAGDMISAKDTWSGFPEERAEIFDFLAEHRISGVMLLSSDRHRNDLRVNRRERGYPLLELESGWLTNQKGSGGSGSPIFEYLDGPAFGFLTFHPADDDPFVIVEIVSINGESVFRREVRLGELKDDENND